MDRSRHQASEILGTGKREIIALDKQADALLDRIMVTDDMAMIAMYERKIGGLTKEKQLLTEKLANQVEPKGTFEEKLEPALTFLANPWKIWVTGQVDLRRVVLKYAFGDRVQYCRKQGARTPKYTLPFKVLGGVSEGSLVSGAARRIRISLSLPPKP